MFGVASSFERETRAYRSRMTTHDRMIDISNQFTKMCETITSDNIEHIKSMWNGNTMLGLHKDNSLGINGHHRVNCHGCGAPHAYGVACSYCGGGA